MVEQDTVGFNQIGDELSNPPGVDNDRENQFWLETVENEKWIRFILAAGSEQLHLNKQNDDTQLVVLHRKNHEELELIEFALQNGRRALEFFERKSAEGTYDIEAWHYFSEASFQAGIIFASCQFSSVDRERILHRKRNLGHQDIPDKERKQIWFAQQLRTQMNNGLKRKDAEKVLRQKITDISQKGGTSGFDADWFKDFFIWQETDRITGDGQHKKAGTALYVSRTFGQKGMPDKKIEEFALRSCDELPPPINL